MRNTLKLILAGLAALIMPATLLTSTTAPAHANVWGELRIVQANVGSSYGKTGDSWYVAMAVDDMQAQVVTMQEICRSEFDRWRHEWGWWGVFTPMTDETENSGTPGVSPGNACALQDKGQAILARPTVTVDNEQKMRLENESSGGKEFWLTCVDISGITGGGTGKLKVCTTHLSATDSALRDRQLNQVKTWLHSFENDQNIAAVFTGDLNMKPESAVLDSLYTRYKEVSHPDGRGADQQPWTIGNPSDNTDRKVDYIFADRPNLFVEDSYRKNPLGDGHRIIRGTIRY